MSRWDSPVAARRSRRAFLQTTMVVGLGWLGAACQSAAAPQPAASPSLIPTQVPAAVSPSGPAPAASDWASVQDAANKEGHVVVIGLTNNDVATVLTDDFQKLYPQIAVDYTALAGGAVGPALLTQLAAGQHQTDLVLTAGMATLLSLRDQNALESIWPYLTGPEGQSASIWVGGKLTFADDQQMYALALSYLSAPALTYNSSAVSPSDLGSFKNLLDPKWKSKLALYDPRVAGTGQAAATMMYTNPVLGPDYLRQLFAQDINLSRDDRQLVDFVVQGVYPIEVSGSQTVVAPLQRSGVTVNMLGGADMQEGGWVSATGASVVTQPPHPNATKVYLDYLLSQPAQLAYATALGYMSGRTDVPHDFVPDILIPQPGVTYAEIYKDAYFQKTDEINAFLASILGS